MKENDNSLGSWKQCYCNNASLTDELAQYQSLVEDSAIGVFVASTADRRVLYTNSAFVEICGFEGSNITGMLLREVLRKNHKKALLTDREVVSLSLESYKEFHVERRGLYLAIKAKAIIWNDIPSYILYIADETSEHQIQLRLQKMIDEVPAGIGIYELRDKEVTLTYINKSYCVLVGLSQEETKRFMKKNHALDGVYEEDHPKIFEMIKKVKAGSNHGDAILRLYSKGEKWTWFHMAFTVIERNGDLIKGYAAFSNCEEVMSAHEEMKRNYIKEQTLMESIPGGTAIYRTKKDGRSVVEYASDGYCKLMGYTRQEVLSHPDISKLVHPDDAKAAAEGVREAIENHKPISLYYRIITKDGEVVLNKIDAKVMVTEELNDEDFAVLYAVHTRVTDEAQLTMQEQKYYRMILSMTGTAYCEWDEENGFYASKDYKNYRISNGGFDALMGRSEDKELVHPEDMPLVMHYMNIVSNNATGQSITIRLKMQDGHYQWTEVVCVAQKDVNDNFVRLVGVFRDVDKEWIERNKKLQKALDEAEKANRAKTAFLSRVSHDMRTPLNGILGLTSFLKDSVTDEKTARDVAQLEISGQYLLNLINDTLDVSRIENGKLELHPAVCDGKETFDNIIKLAKPSIEAKHLEFIINAKNIHFTGLYVDVGRIEQIVMNIIGNAVKFTPEGGTIECSMEELEDTTETVVSKIIIRDTGIGMSKEFIPTIFDAFSQADNNQTNTRQGTGLGMAITKQLVDLMDGTIKVESELGKGSSFSIVMPFKKATREQVIEWKASLCKETDDSILAKKRVLLCEDHPLNREIASRLLQNKGMVIECAENGKIGVEMFEASGNHFYDVVLMDIRMPEMDGLDATRAIRKLPREDAHLVPIIAMTGNSFDEDIAKTIDAGMNAHLSKPIDSIKLFETLRDKLANPQYFKRKKVLVVDDIPLNRAVIKASIEADYDVLEASDGIEALAILKKDELVDVVITDMMMLNMDGVELIKQIRANKGFDHIAIIANTQYEEMTKQKELTQLGTNAFIYKPNMPEDIQEQLRSVLRQEMTEQ